MHEKSLKEAFLSAAGLVILNHAIASMGGGKL
jgi:hypothetical protein